MRDHLCNIMFSLAGSAFDEAYRIECWQGLVENYISDLIEEDVLFSFVSRSISRTLELTSE